MLSTKTNDFRRHNKFGQGSQVHVDENSFIKVLVIITAGHRKESIYQSVPQLRRDKAKFKAGGCPAAPPGCAHLPRFASLDSLDSVKLCEQKARWRRTRRWRLGRAPLSSTLTPRKGRTAAFCEREVFVAIAERMNECLESVGLAWSSSF